MARDSMQDSWMYQRVLNEGFVEGFVESFVQSFVSIEAHKMIEVLMQTRFPELLGSTQTQMYPLLSNREKLQEALWAIVAPQIEENLSRSLSALQ